MTSLGLAYLAFHAPKPSLGSGMLSRREFLTSAAALPVLPSRLLAAESAASLVGTQLYGWGQYYEREGRKLYDHLDEVFSAVRDAGYDYAEGSLDASDPEGNARFADRFKAKGLKAVAIYTGGRLHDDRAEEAVQRILAGARVCAQSGYRVINCNPDPIGRAKTPEELDRQARALNLLGGELGKLGLQLGVHNHTPEMAREGREYRHNFTATDPQKVGFCYDVHWVYRGGVEPKAALKEFGDRIVSWHLRQSREGIWWEDLAPGDIDYRWIAEQSRARKLPQILTVELALENGTKVTRSVVENHRRSREFVKQVFQA